MDSSPLPRRRRDYLDWLRGVAVLLMIEAHLFDSWTRVDARGSGAFRAAMFTGGLGTTLFLVLAGVAVALSAGSKARRTGDPGAAARAVAWRGIEIFGLAFLFRVQAWLLGWSHRTTDLLKVDVLNIMGPSIVFAAFLWRLGRSPRSRLAVFASATVTTAFLTPIVRALELSALPDAIKAYLVPVPGLTTFVFFPWMGLVFAGACAGVVLDAADTPEIERTTNYRLAAAGTVVALASLAGSFLPPLFTRSDFWTSSPSYLLIRAGAVPVAIAAAFAWNRIFNPAGKWDPITQLGRTSLFIYWIHVEMVYGLISLPLHGALTLPQASFGYAAFCAFMLACSLLKERVVRNYRDRSRPLVGTKPAIPG